MDITNYGAAISKITPGTFVPDIASQTPASQPIPSTDNVAGVSGPSFKDTVKELLGNVNDQMVTAQQQSTNLALGKTNDIDSVVKSVEEASLAMQFTMAIRNKILQAYTEVSQMQF
jgi:flagellar hook-basal body complex protein FliE